MKERVVCHLNIVGFRAAVAALGDRSLLGRPYVIAGATGGRALALDCSPEAMRQGVTPGMALAAAERRVKDLQVLPPDLPACERVNAELENVVSRYAPVWENDRAGNLFLDITGTTGLFGPPADCSSRILRELLEKADIKPAAAVAVNKLVSKVATRTIRPTGLIQVHPGTEAEFFAHQDIRILPGMGPLLLRTAAATGIREIGEIATLSVHEAVSIFGKQGALLWNMAQGIDGSRVEEKSGERRIRRQADFDEDVIDETVIRGALEVLTENAGLEMRRDKLGTASISLALVYSDGVKAEGKEKARRLYVTDQDIAAAAERIFQKAVIRRLRVRSIGLSLAELMPLGYEPDLFEPESEAKNRKLQEAVDKIQNRYGTASVMRGIVLGAKMASMPPKVPQKKKIMYVPGAGAISL